jgi:hypothetical protein
MHNLPPATFSNSGKGVQRAKEMEHYTLCRGGDSLDLDMYL